MRYALTALVRHRNYDLVESMRILENFCRCNSALPLSEYKVQEALYRWTAGLVVPYTYFNTGMPGRNFLAPFSNYLGSAKCQSSTSPSLCVLPPFSISPLSFPLPLPRPLPLPCPPLLSSPFPLSLQVSHRSQLAIQTICSTIRTSVTV
eukprot:2801557-Rhodomonas_salina.1